MGLCNPYLDSTTNYHIVCKTGNSLIGTAKFASINAHLGIEQSRRDDLESIGYNLIYFYKGDLPWHGIEADNKEQRYNKIMETKMAMTIDDLCSGIPECYSKYMKYCRALKFDETPDYKLLKKMFKDSLVANSFGNDFMPDWCIPEPKEDDTTPKICTSILKLVKGIQSNSNVKKNKNKIERNEFTSRPIQNTESNKFLNIIPIRPSGSEIISDKENDMSIDPNDRKELLSIDQSERQDLLSLSPTDRKELQSAELTDRKDPILVGSKKKVTLSVAPSPRKDLISEEIGRASCRERVYVLV